VDRHVIGEMQRRGRRVDGQDLHRAEAAAELALEGLHFLALAYVAGVEHPRDGILDGIRHKDLQQGYGGLMQAMTPDDRQSRIWSASDELHRGYRTAACATIS